jgi:hypothetical protein
VRPSYCAVLGCLHHPKRNLISISHSSQSPPGLDDHPSHSCPPPWRVHTMQHWPFVSELPSLSGSSVPLREGSQCVHPFTSGWTSVLFLPGDGVSGLCFLFLCMYTWEETAGLHGKNIYLERKKKHPTPALQSWRITAARHSAVFPH